MTIQKRRPRLHLSIALLLIFSAFSSVRAESILWEPRSESGLVKDFSIILDKIEIKPTSSEERLKTWLDSISTAHISAHQFNQLKNEIEQVSPSTPVILTVKLLRAHSHEVKEQLPQALNLYDEVFRTPLAKEALKPQLSNAFSFYPMQMYLKHIAASQLCRASINSDAKPTLACAFVGVYQSADQELIAKSQECATHQSREHCEEPLQKILELIFKGEEAFPQSFRQQLCSGSVHTRSIENKILCTTVNAILPIASAAKKLVGLGHITKSSLKPYSDALLNPHFTNSNSQTIGVFSNYDYWRLITLLAYERYEEALKSSLQHCLSTTYKALSREFVKIRHKACHLLARPEVWSLIPSDDQYALSDQACRSNTVKSLCFRGFHQADLRERLIKSNISEHLDRFITEEIHPIKIVTRYQVNQKALRAKEIIVQAKTKWGFKWDISGDPEFRLSVFGARGQLIYRAHLIPTQVQDGDEIRLKPDPKRTAAGLLALSDLSDLTIKLEELDPLRSDLVLTRKVKIDAQATLIVQSDLARFTLEKIGGDTVYQEALKALNEPHPLTFYQD